MAFFLLPSSFLFSEDSNPNNKTTYTFSQEAIDVVIPCCAKDRETLNLCIEGIRKFGKNIRRVIVVSNEPLTELAEWFDEKKFPFSKNDIAKEIFQGDASLAEEYLHAPKTRIGSDISSNF